MAITNAVVSSTSNLSTLGRGVAAGQLKRLQNWVASPLLQFVEIKEVLGGNTQTRSVSIAEYGSGSSGAISENATITATALPALEAVSSSLAQYGISIAWTSQAMSVVEDPAELLATMDAMAVESILDYVAHGTTNGIATLASSMSTVTATSGLDLTINAVETGALGIWNTHGASLPLVFIGSPKGIRNLRNDLKSTGAAAMANDASSELVKQLFIGGAIPDSMGFAFELGGIAYFSVNRSGQIYATGSNDYGVLMVAPAAWSQIQAPIVLAGRANPAMARPNATIVAQIGPIGVARYEVEPGGENARHFYYVVEMDSFLSHGTNTSLPARAILYATS